MHGSAACVCDCFVCRGAFMTILLDASSSPSAATSTVNMSARTQDDDDDDDDDNNNGFACSRDMQQPRFDPDELQRRLHVIADDAAKPEAVAAAALALADACLDVSE